MAPPPLFEPSHVFAPAGRWPIPLLSRNSRPLPGSLSQDLNRLLCSKYHVLCLDCWRSAAPGGGLKSMFFCVRCNRPWLHRSSGGSGHEAVAPTRGAHPQCIETLSNCLASSLRSLGSAGPGRVVCGWSAALGVHGLWHPLGVHRLWHLLGVHTPWGSIGFVHPLRMNSLCFSDSEAPASASHH